ncbi:unnamed protein product [Peronospora destructor]|uniref:Cation-transporting P-type ATPase C-terminal domain-containing protein n=1 Tax=Peronospora destructor TaxID=86335 RepID=A0AAV0VII8_9STRA|nr:unnamed protein product [Peronospora destructor]
MSALLKGRQGALAVEFRSACRFVSDGVNDAPLLARADVGVVLGAGTVVALDAADVVLAKDDLRDLLNARALSSATNRRIKYNFAWGTMYNLLMMYFACGVLFWKPPYRGDWVQQNQLAMDVSESTSLLHK